MKVRRLLSLIISRGQVYENLFADNFPACCFGSIA